MELKEAQEKFIQAWGTLGTSWGINKAMAQIHALLLLSPDPLSAEEIMEKLNISRGNANMNLRALIDWGIVQKEHKVGERKEYFSSEKDIWELAKQVVRERRKRELEPVRKMLAQVQDAKGGSKEELKEFKNVTKDISEFVTKADGFMDKLIKADEHWFFSSFMKLIK